MSDGSVVEGSTSVYGYWLTGENLADLLVFVICGGIFVELIRLFF